MAAATTSSPVKALIKHHYVRTTVSAFFGFLAVGLIMTSILAVWLNNTLTNTNQFVKTVAPLVTKPDVQNFVVTKATDGLLDNKDASIQDIASKVLGDQAVQGKTDDQLRAQVRPIMESSLRSVLASSTFAGTWRNANQSIHSQLISQLNGGAQTITLNFHPVITSVIDQLGTTRLGFVKDKLDLPSDAGIVTLKGKQLDNVRKGVNYFRDAVLGVVALAVLFTGLCVWISVHHLKTIRRIAFTVGLYAAFLFALLSASSLFKVSKDEVQQKFITAMVNGITHDLRLVLLVVAILGIGGSVGSKVFSTVRAHKT